MVKLRRSHPITLASLQAEHTLLSARLKDAPADGRGAQPLARLGVAANGPHSRHGCGRGVCAACALRFRSAGVAHELASTRQRPVWRPSRHHRARIDLLHGRSPARWQDPHRDRHHRPRPDRRATWRWRRRASCWTPCQRHPRRTMLLLIDTQGQHAAPARRTAGHQPRDGALGVLHRLGAPSGHRVHWPGVRPGAVGRLHHLRTDRRCLLRIARSRDPGHAHPRHGAHHQDRAERLTELSVDNPVFAPGVDNYVAMGGVRALW